MKKSLNLIGNAKEICHFAMKDEDLKILGKLLPLLHIIDEISTLLRKETAPTLPDAAILFNSLIDEMEQTMESLAQSE